MSDSNLEQDAQDLRYLLALARRVRRGGLAEVPKHAGEGNGAVYVASPSIQLAGASAQSMRDALITVCAEAREDEGSSFRFTIDSMTGQLQDRFDDVNGNPVRRENVRTGVNRLKSAGMIRVAEPKTGPKSCVYAMTEGFIHELQEAREEDVGGDG